MTKGTSRPYSSHLSYCSPGGNESVHGGNYNMAGLEAKRLDLPELGIINEFGLGGNIGDFCIKKSRYPTGGVDGPVDLIGVDIGFTSTIPPEPTTWNWFVEGLDGDGAPVAPPIHMDGYSTLSDPGGWTTYNTETTISGTSPNYLVTQYTVPSGDQNHIQFADVPSVIPAQPFYGFGPHTQDDQLIGPKLEQPLGVSTCIGSIVCVSEPPTGYTIYDKTGEVRSSAFTPSQPTTQGTLDGQLDYDSFLPNQGNFCCDVRKFMNRDGTTGGAQDPAFNQVNLVPYGGGFPVPQPGYGFPTRNLNIIIANNLMPMSSGNGNIFIMRYETANETPNDSYGGNDDNALWMGYDQLTAPPNGGGTAAVYVPLKWGSPGSNQTTGVLNLGQAFIDTNNSRVHGIDPVEPDMIGTGVPLDFIFMGGRNSNSQDGFAGILKYTAHISGVWSSIPNYLSSNSYSVQIIVQINRSAAAGGGMKSFQTICTSTLEQSQRDIATNPVLNVVESSSGTLAFNGLYPAPYGQVYEEGDYLVCFAQIRFRTSNPPTGQPPAFFNVESLQATFEYMPCP